MANYNNYQWPPKNGGGSVDGKKIGRMVLIAAIALFASGQPAAALLFLGAGLVLAGLTVLWLLLCNLTAKGMWQLGKLALRGIKACFIRKKGE